MKIFNFRFQVPACGPRLRLPVQPDVPGPPHPQDRHRQRAGRREGIPSGGSSSHPG